MNRDFIYNIPEKVLFDSSLSLTDLKVYAIVRSFMDTTGAAYPSNNWLANKLNVHRTTIITCINNLCEKGYLVRREVNGRRFLTIMLTPLSEMLVVPRLPPSSVDTTPPSSVDTTQLDQSIITPKVISLVRSDEQTTPQAFPKPLKNITIHNYREHPLFCLYMRFYEHYPKKQQPFDGFKAFIALKPHEELLQILITDVKKRSREDNQWQEKKFIPLIAGYLRREVWLDEIIEEDVKKTFLTPQERTKNERLIKSREVVAQNKKNAEMAQLREFKQLVENGISDEDREAGIRSIQAIKAKLKAG